MLLVNDTAVRRPFSATEAEGLGLTFETNDGPVHALKDVDLAIQKGDFVSFIGPWGCGKTTFLRVAADLEKPTAVTITVNGMSPEEARKSRSYGYVFQAAGLFSGGPLGPISGCRSRSWAMNGPSSRSGLSAC